MQPCVCQTPSPSPFPSRLSLSVSVCPTPSCVKCENPHAPNGNVCGKSKQKRAPLEASDESNRISLGGQRGTYIGRKGSLERPNVGREIGRGASHGVSFEREVAHAPGWGTSVSCLQFPT